MQILKVLIKVETKQTAVYFSSLLRIIVSFTS